MEQTLGKRIVANRKRLELTQDQLAEQLGVTAQAVSKWENDQSCPDIGILPKLANIFGITTDELLGNTPEDKVHQAEVVTEGHAGVHFSTDDGKHNWEFKWDSGRRSAVCFALLVLSVGILYLLLSSRLSFWDVLWPTSILVFGIGGLLRKWSFFSMACTLFGGYTLADKIFEFPFDIGSKTVWAILIILFGFSLLADAIKKPLKPKIVINRSNKKTRSDYSCNDGIFSYECSFGDNRQPVVMDTLCRGNVSVSFGDYTVDLTGVEKVSSDCHIDANCSFGELEFIVPKRFRVVTESSTSFASIDVEGTPDATPAGQILLSGDVSFGEITIEYV